MQQFADLRFLVLGNLGPMRWCGLERTYVLPERYVPGPVQLLLPVQVDAAVAEFSEQTPLARVL